MKIKVKQLLQDLVDAQGQREASSRGILQGLIRQFCEHHSIWHGIVNVVAGHLSKTPPNY